MPPASNLEILNSWIRRQSFSLKVVDKTITAMGEAAQNLLVTPLADIGEISRRLDWVEYFLNNYITGKRPGAAGDIYDLGGFSPR